MSIHSESHAGPPAPPLAVVMPTRQQRGFIAQAVESVMTQGIPGLRLIVQDGDSTDGTVALLAELAARHPGLDWVSEPDTGPAQALNRGFARALATGAPVLGWLNSDDLYTPGAARRALDHLAAFPEHLWVYGEGEHVNEHGSVLGRYPTREPSIPLADWADGCHICQPTVFMRREAWLELGGLDETLRTAFDYDAWLRLLKRFQGRAGMVPQVQAQSRLHAAAITLRMREAVALEALQLIHRHIGPAPAHWLLTCFGEAMVDLPDGSPLAPGQRFRQLTDRARPWLADSACAELDAWISGHRALQLSTAEVYAPVWADGWAPPCLEIRVLRSAKRRVLWLRGHHAHPHQGPLELVVRGPDDASCRMFLEDNGPFECVLPIPPGVQGAETQRPLIRVTAQGGFVPAQCDPGSGDTRELAFLLEGLELNVAA